MLQPSITNGIIAILKIKSALCGETPCMILFEEDVSDFWIPWSAHVSKGGERKKNKIL